MKTPLTKINDYCYDSDDVITIEMEGIRVFSPLRILSLTFHLKLLIVINT